MINLDEMENEYSRDYDIEYRTGFLAGYNRNIMSEGIEIIELKEDSLYSLGYRDGQNYAEYSKIAGIDNVFKPESLEGQIGRTFSQSYSIFKQYEKNYSAYKNGYLSGRYQFLQKLLRGNSNVDSVFEVDEEDFCSLGYYDAYMSCLEDNSQTYSVARINDDQLEPIIKQSFNNRKQIQEGKKKA